MEELLKYQIFDTAWGFFGILANRNGVLRTVLPQDSPEIVKQHLLVGMSEFSEKDDAFFLPIQKLVIDYYEGVYVDFCDSFLPVCLSGSDFARKVLSACMTIKFGNVCCYSELAKLAGFPKSARAVGQILAKNQTPLIVPCHRIICADGRTGNFSPFGGSKLKRKMLEHEKQMIN